MHAVPHVGHRYPPSQTQNHNTPNVTERNLVAVAFHAAVVTLMTVAVAQLPWIQTDSATCVTQLALYQFFDAGFYETKPSVGGTITVYHTSTESLACVGPDTVGMCHVLMVLCALSLASTLAAFFLDVGSCKNAAVQWLQKSAVFSVVTVIIVVAVIGACYQLATILQRDVRPSEVNFDSAYYTVTAAGTLALIPAALTLLKRPQVPAGACRRWSSPQWTCRRFRPLARENSEDWEGMESFVIRTTPPPPYSP